MKRKIPLNEILFLTLGETVVSLLIVGLYLLLDGLTDIALFSFSYKVVTGVILGSAVTVFNYFFLNLSVNRAIDRFLALRGDKEMDEEEAAKFASENAMAVQNAIKTSFIVRTLSILVTLAVAFIAGVFEPLATVIPLLMLRPLIYLSEVTRVKFSKKKESDA